jgi:hypothetical protein
MPKAYEVIVGTISLGRVASLPGGRWEWQSRWQVSGDAKSKAEAENALLLVYSTVQGIASLRASTLAGPVKTAVDKWALNYQRVAVQEAYEKDREAWDRWREMMEADDHAA